MSAVLSIVIPVWNEEEAIGHVLSDIQLARASIPHEQPEIGTVEVLVVDDGSTDRTPEIVARFPGITLICLKHVGYGAALKHGLQQAMGGLLGVMDGDRTYNPRCFASLCKKILLNEAELVNGSRMHPRSKRPLLRYLSNRMVGTTLRLLSGKKITDGCTGMLVFDRSILPLVKDCPDDLSFSPALSARLLFSSDLRMAEVPVDCARRLGHSKLSLLKDTANCFKQAFSAYARRRDLRKPQKVGQTV
jgi:glycosyltransferase involved in cell wall biosynthesis